MSDETYEIIGPGHTYESVTESISRLVLTNRVSPLWILVFAVLVTVTGILGMPVQSLRMI